MDESAPPRERGVLRVTSRRADGTQRIYFYDRASGARLPDDPAQRAATLGEMRRAKVRERAAAAEGTLDDAIRRYYADEAFTSTRPRTQAFYREHLERLREDFGDLPVALISPEWVQQQRDDIIAEGHAHKARHRQKVLRMLLSFASSKLKIAIDAAVFRVRLARIQPRDQVWTAEHERAFLKAAADEPLARRGYFLGAYTAQRLTDILAMRRSQLRKTREEGRTTWWISLRQEKTGKHLWVPVHPRLLKELGTQGKPDDLLVPSPRGKQFDRWGFHRVWDRTVWAAGLGRSGLQFRDLRRTAMVRMAEAGATPIEIAAVSGHSIEETMRILETYIPRNRLMALAAVRRLR
jgi:hypothetical protein